MFSCEFCEISKNTFSYRTPPVAASGALKFLCGNHSARKTSGNMILNLILISWKLVTIERKELIKSFIITIFKKQSPEVFCKKRFSEKFCKIHRKAPVPESFFNKVDGMRAATLLKRRLWHRCLPVNFAKFLRTPFS